MTELKWLHLMKNIGFDTNMNTYVQLLSSYSEKHRHYHNSQHISAVLSRLEQARHLAEDYNAVEVALWFHDAKYSITSSNNELDSANWASHFLDENGASQEFSNKVYTLIMATLHDVVTEASDEQLIIDIDLSILGREPKIYDAFESAIRKEYKSVPSVLYRRKRKLILSQFLEREKIYSHLYFYEKLEISARLNLARAIQNL